MDWAAKVRLQPACVGGTALQYSQCSSARGARPQACRALLAHTWARVAN